MKKSKYIITGLVAALLTFSSCQLAEELDDYEPLYSLDADTAINSEATANLALSGTYAAFRQKTGGGAFPIFYILPDLMSGYAQTGPFVGTNAELIGFTSNAPIATSTTHTINMYGGLYDLINRSNWLIEKVSLLDAKIFADPGRKAEILAEAKTLRALGHFYLLRTFGQFYDINSEYGILVQKSPAKQATVQPRNTVAETYEAILSDLDSGIADAPANRGKKYTNRTFAKALKARVLLYMGDYNDSAALCREIIAGANAAFKLESSYGAIFDEHASEGIFTSSEILFGSAGQTGAGIGMGNFYSGSTAVVAAKYKTAISASLTVGAQAIKIDNTRASVFFTNTSYGGLYTTKYTSYFTVGANEMFYHMRMAEVYLILAEAGARSSLAVTTEALEALNTIRRRAGAVTTGASGFETYPASISYDQFLTAVRMEKLAELQAEGGETWFDLVRYDFLDGFGTGFQVSSVKTTAVNPDKFILPIPTESIDAGNRVIKQNPSY